MDNPLPLLRYVMNDEEIISGCAIITLMHLVALATFLMLVMLPDHEQDIENIVSPIIGYPAFILLPNV